MLPFYKDYFNTILDTGIVPESWLSNPENYRPITLISCFSKLFTSILNKRLNTYLEEFEILHENQAGFRSGYSTTDHVFVLHSLLEILKVRKIKLFVVLLTSKKPSTQYGGLVFGESFYGME